MATQPTVTWDDVRRLADELHVKLHLAGMEARDRWRALEPRLTALEHDLARSGKRMTDAVERELAAVGTLLRRLHDDLIPPAP
jgi:hypothetical protein